MSDVTMSEELKDDYRNETISLIKQINSGRRLRSLYSLARLMVDREEKEKREVE